LAETFIAMKEQNYQILHFHTFLFFLSKTKQNYHTFLSN